MPSSEHNWKLPVPPFPACSQSEHCGGDAPAQPVPGCPCHHLSSHLLRVGAQSRAQGLCEDSAALPGTLPAAQGAPARGYGESQRKWPNVTEGGHGEGGGFLSAIHILCGMEGKRIDFGVADSFCGGGKKPVRHDGNGNTFNG